LAVCLFVWSEDWIWSRAEARAAARILWEASLFSWFFGGIGGSARRVFGRLRVRIRVGLGLFRQWPVVGSPPSLSFLFGDSNLPIVASINLIQSDDEWCSAAFEHVQTLDCLLF
jgi:hypothetical protein